MDGAGWARDSLVLLGGWFAFASYGAWVLNVEKEQQGLGVWFGPWGSNLGMFAAYAWSTGESLRYYALMRRRVRIGIGDPLVANRFLLWGIGTLATLLVTLLYIGMQLFGHYELPASLLGVSSTLVLVSAIAEWLAFLPAAVVPRALREGVNGPSPSGSRIGMDPRCGRESSRRGSISSASRFRLIGRKQDARSCARRDRTATLSALRSLLARCGRPDPSSALASIPFLRAVFA